MSDQSHLRSRMAAHRDTAATGNPFKRSALSLGVALACSATVTSEVLAETVEEIVVTATRRAESIQDIPVNISAVGGDAIEQQGFDDLSELASYVPGLNIVDQGGRDGNRIVVRGLNAEPISNSFGQENGGAPLPPTSARFRCTSTCA